MGDIHGRGSVSGFGEPGLGVQLRVSFEPECLLLIIVGGLKQGFFDCGVENLPGQFAPMLGFSSQFADGIILHHGLKMPSGWLGCDGCFGSCRDGRSARRIPSIGHHFVILNRFPLLRPACRIAERRPACVRWRRRRRCLPPASDNAARACGNNPNACSIRSWPVPVTLKSIVSMPCGMSRPQSCSSQ